MADNDVARSTTIRADEVLSSKRLRFKRERGRISPNSAAIAGRLIEDNRRPVRSRNYNKNPDPNIEGLYERSQRIAANINDIENIFEILPEMERCEMIMVSCILSPDDMKTITFQHICDSKSLPSKSVMEMIAVMEEYTTVDYKIKDMAPKILSDALFRKGSRPIAIIPESTLDYLINNDNGNISQESLNIARSSLSPLGTLGDNDATRNARSVGTRNGRMSFEEIFTAHQQPMTDNRVGKFVTVTDNPAVLRLPELQTRVVSERLSNIYGNRLVGDGTLTSMEAFDKDTITLNDVARRLTRRRRHRTEQMVAIKPNQSKRNNIGHALIMNLPPESVIPVHVPNDETQHVGYFILLDEFGNPINTTQDSLYSKQLKDRLKQQQSDASNTLTEVKTQLFGQSGPDMSVSEQDLTASYGDYVMRDVLERLSNGAYAGRSVQVSRPSEVNRLLLARALSNKYTQVLYMPAELVTYFAFYYNKDGTGRSLSDRSKILASIRAMVLLASTQAAIRGAVGHKEVKLTLDPDDPDPDSSIEQYMHGVAIINNGNFPLGSSDPNDLMTYMLQAGLSVVVEGHPEYPEIRAEMNSVNNAIQPIDRDLDDSLRAKHIATYGLPPESVDAQTGVDFAATIRTSNVYFDKQVSMYKNQFCDQMSEHLRKCAVNSGTILPELFEIIERYESEIDKDIYGDNWKVEAVTDFLDNYRVDLPEPENTKAENQLRELSDYSQLVDAVFAVIVPPDVLAQMHPEMDSSVVEATVNVLKQQVIREFIQKKSIAPEIMTSLTSDANDSDEETIDMLTKHTQYIELLSNGISNLMQDIKEKRTKQAEMRGQDTNDGGMVGDGYNSSDDDGFGGNDDFTGGNDFGETDGATRDDNTTNAPGLDDDGNPDSTSNMGDMF